MILFPSRRKILKNNKLLLIIFGVLTILLTSSCSLKKDDLENATIYTTVYPINYLTNYLYGEYGQISSIYPNDCDLSTYKLTKKQIEKYSSADLFIYNGLSNEKDIAKKLLNKNRNMLIIDVSYGLTLKNDATELWLSPNNFLMLAKNIKDNLEEYLTSKMIIETIESNYKTFEENISLMDALLHSYGAEAKESNKNIIITSNSTFKYLEKYGYNIISLQDSANLKDNKLNAIKSNFQSQKYKYIMTLTTDEDNDVINDLTSNYGAQLIKVDPLTLSLEEDYFTIMTDLIEDIKLAAC